MSGTTRSGRVSLTEPIVDFVHGFKLDDAPLEVRRAGPRLIADALVCALAAAADSEIGPILRRYLAGDSVPGPATLYVGGSADLRAAALVNATLVRYLDANDIYLGRPGRDSGHFSDAIPAVLAVAEATGASGRALLEAVIVAYEVQGVLAESHQWMAAGFHPTSQVAIAVALAAGRLLGMDRVGLRDALGTAVTSGMLVQTWLRADGEIPMLKATAAGLAAERGVVSALLASAGASAPADALEQFIERFPSDLDGEPVGWLGSRWATTRNAIKVYPAQIFIQAAAECAAALHGATVLEDVRVVEVRSHAGACAGVQAGPASYRPQTRAAADHSTPFVVASVLRLGRLLPADYRGAPWTDPEILRQMDRVVLVSDPAFEEAASLAGRYGAEVIVTTASGARRRHRVDQFRGHPDLPLDDEALLSKWRSFMAALGMKRDRASDILQASLRLPEDGMELLAVIRTMAAEVRAT